MDPLSLVAVGLVGYWIFRSLQVNVDAQPRSQTAEPKPQSEPVTAALRESLQSETESRPTYATTAECFKSEYVSFSRLKSYTSCPHRFRLAYLDGKRGVASHFDHTASGKDFHDLCERLFRSQIGEPIRSVEDVRMRDRLGNHSARLEFLRNSLNPNARIMAVEHELRFAVRGIAFFGIVDLVLRDGDGITHIIDYKTGRSPRSYLEQLEMYCLPVLLAGTNETVRLSFILVDAQECIHWEVGPHNREEVVQNVFRIVDHMLGDAQFPPRISSGCKACSHAHHCQHQRRRKKAVKVTWPTLTPAKRGVSKRRAREREQSRTNKGALRKYSNSPSYYFAAYAAKAYTCDATGQVINEGDYHFATKNGRRLSVNGFRSRYPNSPFPTQTKQERYGG